MEMEKKPEDIEKYSKEYSDSGFWEKIKKFACRMGVKPLYVALLLYYYIPKASFLDKTIIVGSLGFLISPIDLILDTIPVIGFADDIAILMYVYYRVNKKIDDEVRLKAKEKLISILGKNYDENEIKEL